MFHRVDEPLDLPSPRFFGMAKWLRTRGGAVSELVRQQAQPDVRAEVNTSPAAPAVAEGTADDIAALAAMSQNSSGFPGIGYSGG